MGVVRDKETGQPVRAATVTAGSQRTVTDASGRFGIAGFTQFPVTLSVSHIGYQPASLVLYAPPDSVLSISLVSKAIGLSEVLITAPRDPIKDSLHLREEYADQFDFKPIKPLESVAISPIGIAINLNMLYASLSREQKQAKRLKAVLIRNEQEGYVDRRFTKALILEQTNISDTEIDIFHWFFKPTYDQMVGFSDYDLLMYIREKYADFTDHREKYPAHMPTLDFGG